MKKTFKAFLCCICAVALFSCEKETRIPEEGTVPEGYTLQTFTATGEAVITRTALSGANTVWSKNDQIKVILNDGTAVNAELTDGAGTATGTFAGMVPDGKTALYAVYPAAAYSSVDGTTVNVSVSDSQAGTFSAGNIAVAKVGAENNMSFKNVTAFLAFQLKAGSEVTKVEVTSVDGGALSGTVPVSCSGENPVPGTPASTASTVSMSTSGAGTYYMTIVQPAANHTKGLKMTYYTGSYTETGVYYLNRNLPIAANNIYTLGEVETDKNYYVTVSGAGNHTGMDWSNAFSKDEMWKRVTLTSAQEADASTKAAKLAAIDGATFHMGAGEYNFGATPSLSFDEEDPITLTFKGGYPAAGGARNLASYKSDFSGNEEHAALILSGKMNITLDGVGIIKGASEAADAAALQCSGSNLSVTMTDCHVRNNTNTAATAGINLDGVGTFTALRDTLSYNSASTKAAMSIVNTAATMTDCVFDHNSSSGHSSVFRSNCGGLTCTFTGCTFSNNTAAGEDGGAILRKAGRLEFINCDFTDNTNSASKGYGGAISTTSEGSGTIYISGGTFSGNQAYSGGAIAMRTGWLDAHDVTFDNNVSSGRAAAVYAEQTANLTRCTFSGNHAKWGGAAYIKGADKTLQIYGGTWEDNYAYNGGAILAGSSGSVTIGISQGVGATFSSNYATQQEGGALRNEGDGNISITGATFSGNYTSMGKGGAIYNGSSGNLSISGTTFSGNSTRGTEDVYYGGAVASVHSDSEVTITDCEFTGNYSNMYGGTALSYQSGSEGSHSGFMRVSNTVFSGNHNDYDGTDDSNYGRYGGAVRLGHDYTPSYFDNCTFTDNYTNTASTRAIGTWGGAVTYYADGMAYFNNCHFEGNHATRGGAIASWGCTVSGLYLNGCSFSGNWISYYYGTAIYVEKTKYFCMNNCSFSDDTYTTRSGGDEANWICIDGESSAKALEECVISNCSIIGSGRSTSSLNLLTNGQELIYILNMKSGKKSYLINNCIIASGTEQYAWWTNAVDTYGYNNIYSAKGNTGGSYTANNDTGAKTYANLGSPVWNSTDYIWPWDGTGFSYTKITASTIATQVNNGSSSFKTWLEDNGLLNKDQLGNDRGSGDWTPGAYQPDI